MINQVNVAKYSGNGFRCVYNADRLTEKQLDALLENGGGELFGRQELICETSNALSYTVQIDGAAYFAKRYKRQGLCKRLLQPFVSPAETSFQAGVRLTSSSLPTPMPIMACKVKRDGRRTETLITDYCENARLVSEQAETAPKPNRMVLIEELAFLLAEFHGKGFHSPHLRSSNILVSQHAGKRGYWFIDLDRLTESRLLGAPDYIDTISRVCGPIFVGLKGEERKHLLRVCFNAALKQNIYKKPSDEEKFRQSAVARMKRYTA